MTNWQPPQSIDDNFPNTRFHLLQADWNKIQQSNEGTVDMRSFRFEMDWKTAANLLKSYEHQKKKKKDKKKPKKN